MTSQDDVQTLPPADKPNDEVSVNADPTSSGADSEDVPWHKIVAIVIVGAIVLLFGLPIAAVWVVNATGCCAPRAMESLVTFWAALSAGFLALFGLVVTSAFIVTSFRVNAQARAEARIWAQKEGDRAARTYLKRRRAKLFRRMNESVVTVRTRAAEAREAIATAEKNAGRAIYQQAENARIALQREEREASGGIKAIAEDAREELLNTLRREAQNVTGLISEVRDETITAAHTMREEVEQARDMALQAIAQAREEAQRRLGPPEGSPPSEDEDEPK